MKVDTNKVMWLAVGFFVGVAVGIVAMVLRSQTRPAAIVINPPEPLATPEPTAEPTEVTVFVSGEVLNPAVYTLPFDARVEVAIEAAGGFSEQADVNQVNLAQPLAEGMQIYVPVLGELDSPPAVVEAVEETTAVRTVELDLDLSDGELVNINTATVEELDVLPGIGPSTAQKIIDHRDANGPFGSIEDIQDVSGIGPAKFEEIKDLITVDGG